MLTSLGRREDKEGMDEFDAFLYKPMKPSALFNALVVVFSGRPIRVVPGSSPKQQHFNRNMGNELPRRILLVEDNTTNQKLALALLARLGYRADLAGNGFEALEAIRRQPYDVVLMDMQMPEMDGLEATRQLRRELKSAVQPYVVAMTANAMPGDRDICLEAGMNDYVSKPIHIDELVRALLTSNPQASEQKSSTKESQPLAGKAEAGAVEQPHAPISAGAKGILDPDVLENLQSMLGGEFSSLEKLVDTFLEDAPHLLVELKQFTDSGDSSGIRRIAHSLKSNGADFGALNFSELCKDLELIGKSGKLEGAAGLYRQIEVEFGKVKTALEDLQRAGKIR
jgi:CheY-like chemotaxis protein/HPt (histidine-containing phosphotransfer) domain-containing protein